MIILSCWADTLLLSCVYHTIKTYGKAVAVQKHWKKDNRHFHCLYSKKQGLALVKL